MLTANIRVLRVALVVLVLCTWPWVTAAHAQARKAAKPSPAKQQAAFAKHVQSEIASHLKGFEETGDAMRATAALQAVFDQVIAFAPVQERSLFRDSALALRLVQLLKDSPTAERKQLAAYLRANPELASTLGFLVKFDQEKPGPIVLVLQKLRSSHGGILNKYAQLAAAVCVVHDQQVQLHIGTHQAISGDPLPIFEYFIANERQLALGLQNVPAELLIYVVDSVAGVDEMQWALSRYAGNTNIGDRFFEIKYDYDHFTKYTPKKYLASGFNLPSIHRHGGVCAEQAYFAMAVGKSIGIPAVYMYGQSGEVAHAWVGYLEANQRTAAWNFDAGRYEEYQGVRGQALDPQIGKRIPDSYIALLAEHISNPQADRHYAAAMTDAAARLLDLRKRKQPLKAEPPEGIELAAIRKADVSDALAILEAGLSASAGYAQGWLIIRDLATEGALSIADKRKWEGVLHRLCGKKYPDFYLAILGPMIKTVEQTQDQDSFWNAAFAHFQQRHDLAAQVRLEQADMWLKVNQPVKAGRCCEEVIDRYVNAGPFVVSALQKAEKILRDANDTQRVLALYDNAWSRAKRPQRGASEFQTQSNWFRIGTLYAKHLHDAGRSDEAARVLSTLTSQ